jgi:hypothetical protein
MKNDLAAKDADWVRPTGQCFPHTFGSSGSKPRLLFSIRLEPTRYGHSDESKMFAADRTVGANPTTNFQCDRQENVSGGKVTA